MIDWFPAGKQQITIMRGCHTPEKSGELPENKCFEGESSSMNYMYKDCTYHCDGGICNMDMSVGDAFS